MFQFFNLCDEFSPVNVEDGAETALIKSLEGTNMTAQGDPSLLSIEEGGKNHRPVTLSPCIALQDLIAPNTFVQCPKRTICL